MGAPIPSTCARSSCSVPISSRITSDVKLILSVHRRRVGGGTAYHREHKRTRTLVRRKKKKISWRAATASPTSSGSRAYDVCAYDAWCIDRGIDAPALFIGYVAGGAPDESETRRGCIASAPVASGRVITPSSFPPLLAPPPHFSSAEHRRSAQTRSPKRREALQI